MKRVTYYLNTEFKDGETEFPPWTLIQPIDEIHVPSHLMDVLNEARKYRDEEYIMCIIGMKWYPLKKAWITERR